MRTHLLWVGAGLALGFFSSAHADETLLEIYQLARQHDAELQTAEQRFEAALRREPLALSKWLPQLSYQYELGETRQSLDGGRFGSQGGRDRYTTRSDRLVLEQAVYRHDYYVDLQRAESIVARELARRDVARQALITRVAQAYFDVLAAQDNVIFAAQEKSAIHKQLQQAEARFQVGLASLVEVKETQASYDLATAREIGTQNTLAMRLEQMAIITGRPHDTLAPLSDRVRPSPPEPADIEAWTATALERNLNYLLQQQATKVAQQTVRYEHAKHWPTLDFSATFNTTEDTGGIFGGSSELDTDSVNLRLNVPLLRGGQTYYRTEQAQYEYEAEKATLRRIRRETEQQARSAFRDVVADVSRVRAFARALDSARIDLEANVAGQQTGIRDTVDVVQATSRLYAAERDYAQARYDYLLNTLALRRASGQLTIEDLERINLLLD